MTPKCDELFSHTYIRYVLSFPAHSHLVVNEKIQFENVIEMMTMGEKNAWLSAYMFITYLVSHTVTSWHATQSHPKQYKGRAWHTMTMASDPAGGDDGDGVLNNNW